MTGFGRIPRRALPRLPADPTAATGASDPADHARHLVEAHNSRVLRTDSLAVGVTNAATPFLPVLVARLGGSSVDVGLITVVPAVAALFLAVPVGAALEGKADLVRWFSLSRLVAWLAYAAIAVVVLVVPRELAVPAVLGVWIVIAAPATIGQVAFNIVMNDAAGPGGRYELLGRRWATMGLSGAAAVAATGWVLDRLQFPSNYAVAFAAFGLAGVVAARAESQIRLVSRPATPPERLRLRAFARVRWGEVVTRYRSFVRYLVAHGVIAASIRLVTPVVTLFYVRGVHASDAEIGLIATASSLATFAGYHVWRHLARRFGGRRVLLASSAITGVYPIVLGLSPNPLVAGAIAALGAAASGGLSLALFDELMKRVPARRAMAFSATDYAVANAVGIVAPLAGAVAADALGLPLALAIGGSIGLLAAVLFATDRARPAEPAVGPAAADADADAIAGESAAA
jgi:hypothetical protein